MPGVLAPALGRLAGSARQGAFEEVRLALVDTLVSAHATGALGGAVWLDAWQRAMESVRDVIMQEAAMGIDAAAARSRFPAARVAASKPDSEARETLLNRLLAEGESLERLAGPASDDAMTRARGAVLETAWDAAMRIASAERAHWAGVAHDVAQWRRPWRPLVITALISLLLASVLAAMLGGVLPAPAWFAPVTEWFWNLPWP